MSLQLQNINDAKKNLEKCNVHAFKDIGQSFKNFVSQLTINRFRKLHDVEINFDHPVTVISGTNTVGKTSILLLLACSHEEFRKYDSTSPTIGMRTHAWKDVLAFTSFESDSVDYAYSMRWRVGAKLNEGNARRDGKTRSWSGLAKKSSDPSRINAKIRGREVRLIDLERILPGRSFSNTLLRKANSGSVKRLSGEVEQAFSYIFDSEDIKIYEIGVHINKVCFLINRGSESYSSYNAASGEEAVLYLLNDIIESPKDSLILIDEVEAGFHPSVQRKISNIIQYISWRDKKQFVVTTHSSTFASSFPPSSRIFIEAFGDDYKVTPRLPSQAILSKMDSIGHPLILLYCEDELSEFLIAKALLSGNEGHGIMRMVNIIRSGPVDQVESDYKRHKRNFEQYRNKIGYGAIIDGDYYTDKRFSSYAENTAELVGFIYPHAAPEKFLISSYLQSKPNARLRAMLEHDDHHGLFLGMASLGLAADAADARNICYACFAGAAEYKRHVEDIINIVNAAIRMFSS